MKIGTKLYLSSLLAIVLSIGSISTLVIYKVKENVLSSYEAFSYDQLGMANEYVSNMFSQAKSSALFLANLPNMTELQGQIYSFTDTTKPYLHPRSEMPPLAIYAQEVGDALLKANTNYAAVIAGLEDGGFFQSPDLEMPAGYDPRKRGWYKDTINSSEETFVSEVYPTAMNTLASTVCAKLYNKQGELIGVFGIDIILDTLADIISKLKIGKTGYVMLIENTGVVLANSKEPAWISKNVADLNIDALKKIMQVEKNTFTAEVNGKEEIFFVSTGAMGWKLAVVLEASEVYEASNTLTKNIIIIGLILTILLMLMAYAIGRTISKPINILSEASIKIANGDLSALPSQEKMFTGELKGLRNSLKTMIESLNCLLQESTQKTSEAKAQSLKAQEAMLDAKKAHEENDKIRQTCNLELSGKLDSIVNGLSSEISALNKLMAVAREHSEAQRKSSTNTSEAMDEMNASVLDIATNAAKASENAENTREEALRGSNTVNEVIIRIRNIAELVQDMHTEIETLGKQAQDIDSIMVMISDVADQTNLLALNAAIEAARAGEAGRGFAVVADEVRKLAEKTRLATGEVGTAVTTIQHGTKTTSARMNEISQAVAQSEEEVVLAGKALECILESFESTTKQVHSIAAASAEQKGSSEEINESTFEIMSLAEEVDRTVKTAEEAVARVFSLSENIKDIIDNLKNAEEHSDN